MDDQLHMNERGYAIWARVLRPVVEKEFRAAGTEVRLHTDPVHRPVASRAYSHHFDRCDRGRPGWSA